DLMTAEARDLLAATARVSLMARHGPAADELARLAPSRARAAPGAARPSADRAPVAGRPELEFFNGLGGFDRDGTEYVTILDRGATTPAPWINVIADAGFGFQVSADG